MNTAEPQSKQDPTSNARKVALITGGTTGIGFATAKLLHEQGYAVLITGQNPDTLAAAKKNLPGEVAVIRADARVFGDAVKVAAEIQSRFGRLDAVFLNAGIHRMQPFESVDEASFDELFASNFKGQYFTLQKALPFMKDGGSIILNASLSAKKSMPNWSAYSATKGAVLALVPSLAVELAPRGIRVNGIVTGPIETPAFDKLGLPPEAIKAFAEFIPTHVPLGRLGRDLEVANLVAFLASSASSFITGTNITIDGGMNVQAFANQGSH